MAENKKIVLGSGLLYVVPFVDTIPADTELEKQENLIGYIKGGATLTYTPTFYKATDDLGYVAKTIITDEEVVLKSGVMTWNGETLKKLCSTAEVTKDASTRTVKIGGIAKYTGQKYVIHFVHEDSEEGWIKITIVGNNESGFEMAFAKDSETVINAEFKAVPQDETGTLITYKEEIKTA